MVGPPPSPIFKVLLTWPALYLLKWVHTVEVESNVLPKSTEEEAIFSELKQSLDEIDYSYNDHFSLAAAVARAWAPFLMDVSYLIELVRELLRLSIPRFGSGVSHQRWERLWNA